MLSRYQRLFENSLPKFNSFNAYLKSIDLDKKRALDSFLNEQDLDFLYPDVSIKQAYKLYEMELKERYESRIPELQQLNFPLTIFRCVTVKGNKNKAFEQNVGIYWSDDESNAVCYMANSGKAVILRALVMQDDIDWLGTLHVNLVDYTNEENEIRLHKNKKIRLTGIKEQGKEWEPLDFVVIS